MSNTLSKEKPFVAESEQAGRSRDLLTLSIVIPVYNEENHLKRCLDAIAGQAVKPLEVIVVDNNSTDKTVDIARNYSFVKIIHEPVQGRTAARNAGFNAAKGDIIGRIDADTILPPSWAAHVVKFFESNKKIAAITGPCCFNTLFGKNLLFVLHRIVYFWSSWLAFGHQILFGSNMAITRAAWRKVSVHTCVRTDIHEDMDLSHHLVKSNLKVVFDPKLKAVISARSFKKAGSYIIMWLRTRLIRH